MHDLNRMRTTLELGHSEEEVCAMRLWAIRLWAMGLWAMGRVWCVSPQVVLAP